MGRWIRIAVLKNLSKMKRETEMEQEFSSKLWSRSMEGKAHDGGYGYELLKDGMILDRANEALWCPRAMGYSSPWDTARWELEEEARVGKETIKNNERLKLQLLNRPVSRGLTSDSRWITRENHASSLPSSEAREQPALRAVSRESSHPQTSYLVGGLPQRREITSDVAGG